jgi:anti-anti-sigma factor
VDRATWLTCGVDRRETVAVVRVRGEIDAFTSADLDRCLAAALSDSPDQVVIDLSEVAFIDGSGLRHLDRFQQECRDRGIPLSLAGPTPCVQRLLESVMDRVFPARDLSCPGS